MSFSSDYFIVSKSSKIQSTQLYHLLITDPPHSQSYSFYFRYNSLKSINESAKNDQNNKYYPQNIVFPAKNQKTNRMTLFREYFSNFFPPPKESATKQTEISVNKHLNFKISRFLESLGLESTNPIDLPLELVNFIGITIPNRFAKDHTFTLNINGKNFLFVKGRRLGGGGYGEVYLYYLNGSREESHKFAIKSIEFQSDDDLDGKLNKMKSILAESKIFMRFDHENIVKGSILT